MTVRQLIDTLYEIKDKSLLVCGEDGKFTPMGWQLIGGNIRFCNWKLVEKRWVCRKHFIREHYEEVCPLMNPDFQYDSLDRAVAVCATNVFNEIGWKHPDLVGRYTEVCENLRSGKPYSFADAVWQICER